MDILVLIILALLGEAIWETLKMTWQEGKLVKDRVGALVISILLAAITGINIMDLLGVTISISFIGVIFTGILISRGATFVHELLKAVENIKLKNEKELL